MQVLPVGDALVGGRLGVQRGHDVGGEAAFAGAVLADDHGGLVDGRVGAQDGLDLAGFDAEAADLDLGVDAAVELQPSVRLPAHQVTRAVEAFAGCGSHVGGGGDEAFGGEGGAAEVAAGQAVAREVELSRDPGGDGAESVVEDVGAGAGVGDADGHDGAGGGVRVAEAEGGVGGGLGRAVGVEHHPAACVAADQLGRDAFGARQQGCCGRELDVLGHGGEQRRREDHEGDAVLVGVVGEGCARDAAVGGDEDEPAAGEQAEAQVPERDVEAG